MRSLRQNPWALWALAAALGTSPTFGEFLTVNSLADDTTPADGLVTLREAIIAANDDSTTDLGETGDGYDTVDLCWIDGTITLTGPLPNITSDMTIFSGGPESVIVDGAGAYRVFFVESGQVDIWALTIANGAARGGNGGAGYAGGGGGAGLGGALFVAGGFVSVEGVHIIGNLAQGGDGGGDGGLWAGGGGGGIGGNGGNAFGASGGAGGGGGPLNGVGGVGATEAGQPGGDGGEGAGGGGTHESGLAGGTGGFGGGGGAAGASSLSGGQGGWGGGAGAPGGSPGAFGGSAVGATGGGGAGLGGAIFARGGHLVVFRCTLENNSAVGGTGPGGGNGQGKGGAIFAAPAAIVRMGECEFLGNAATDAAGSGNDTVDVYGNVPPMSPPVVTSIVRLDPNPTNAATVTFRVTFDQKTMFMAPSDFLLTTTGTITGASVDAVSLDVAAVTDVTVSTGAGSGTLRLDAHDDDSLWNIASQPLGGEGAGNGDFVGGEAYTIDRAGPSVTLASVAPSRTNAPITVTVTLNEASTDFAAADITPTNALVSNFSGSGTAYSFTLTPASEGAFSAVVAAGACTDALGNLSAQSNTLTRTYDTTAPTLALSTTATDPTNAAIPVVATLSEETDSFAAEDVTVTNGAITNFAGSGSSYTFSIVPAGPGLVTAAVAAGAITDLAGNVSTTASNTLSLTYDNTAPGIILATNAPAATNAAIDVIVTLSQASTNFAAGDVTVSNAALTNFAGSGTSYSFTLEPYAPGPVTAAVNAGAFTDAAGNGNTASNTLSRTFDNLPPVAELSTPAGAVTKSAIAVTVTLSESILDFTVEDLAATNAAVADFAGSGASFSFTLIPAGAGEVNVSIPAGAFSDAAGNTSPPSNVLSRVYDADAPRVASITPAVSSITDATSVEFSVVFTEPVSGLDEPADVSVIVEGIGYASVEITHRSATEYAVTVGRITGAGTLRIAVREAAVTDAAGNTNPASEPSPVVSVEPINIINNDPGTSEDPPPGDPEPEPDPTHKDPTQENLPLLFPLPQCGLGVVPALALTAALFMTRCGRRRRR